MGKGGEAACWTGGSRESSPVEAGVICAGAVYFQTAMPARARLNGVAVAHEFQVDGEGKTRATEWKWK